ncbi:MAG TPA: hypothetical protein VG347_20495 [Verrucomicrobiae bacterium]|nr:hypothetical protein [Verrucomicrobiae bacterium]
MATGKISRLPREIREQLNRQMDEGVAGKRLVGWLNGLPEVRVLLAAEFGGAAIKEQNLTNWKQGGFRDWRIEQQARALAPASADGAAPPVMTLEQLTTAVAIRHLLVVREWMESPIPVKKRWRQMRVIVRDVLKLQRQGQAEKRLELNRERLQFAKERFEDRKEMGIRRMMVAVLVRARQWPEVQEAFAAAFRLFQERKTVKTGGKEAIKVNQGTFKKDETQTESVSCSPSPTDKVGNLSPVTVANGRTLVRDDGAHGVTRPTCATVSKKLHTDSAVTNANLSRSGQIKVDQGDVFLTGRKGMGTIRPRCATARQVAGRIDLGRRISCHPPPLHRSPHRQGRQATDCACAGVNQKSFGRFYMTCSDRFRQAFAVPQ